MVAASIRKHIEHTKGGETKRNTEQKKRLQNVGRVRARTRKVVRASEQDNNYAVLAFLVCPAAARGDTGFRNTHSGAVSVVATRAATGSDVDLRRVSTSYYLRLSVWFDPRTSSRAGHTGYAERKGRTTAETACVIVAITRVCAYVCVCV